MSKCAVCGQASPDGFRFCGACGAELAPDSPKREVRKTVTVVFTDISGSTALGERLDPEALRKTMASYFEEIRRIIERHGGTVEKFIGDAAMAVFGIPLAQEDDALRAVRAVAEIRDRLQQLGQERSLTLSFRTGVNTGQVVAGQGETLATGDAVNVAARLEQAATPGEILIGAETLALVRDAVITEPVEPLQLKGKRDPVLAYRLISVDPGASAIARHLDSPLVGRIREKKRLNADFDDLTSERACHLFTLLGPAGVGKSRLVAEFLANVGDKADVMRGRCLHYGDDITYWPLVEILIAIGVEPDTVIGGSPAETQLAFRKLLEERAADKPQIVVFDDIQWAEPVFLDLIEHVADWSRDAPILLLCVARRELLEVREGWGGGKVNSTTILLEALSGEDCGLLLEHLAGDLNISDDLAKRILAAADGNPLFIEEMIAMVGQGQDRGDRDDDAQIVVPPTIQALLQARLDGLHAEERDVIGRGAVEGQVFHRGAVLELAPELEKAGVSTHLLSLIRKEMIRPERAMLPDESEAFRFRHLLIRDAAYDSMPKQTRAELHERFATWLEHGGGLVELDEIVGYHLEQAHRNRAELDPADPHLEDLASRAAVRLEAAAKGAVGRGDWAAAIGMLERTVALLPQGDPRRLDALIRLAWPLNNFGRAQDARAAAAELAESDDPRFRSFADMIETMTDCFTGQYNPESAIPRIDAAMIVFQELGDELGMAWADWIDNVASWEACRARDAQAAALRGIAHAEAADDRALAHELRKNVVATTFFGPDHIDEAIRAAESLLEEVAGHSLETATAGGMLGRALAVKGDVERGRALEKASFEKSHEAGLLVYAAAGCMSIALVEVAGGELGEAERVLRAGIEELDRLGDRGFYATAVLILAELLEHQGRYDEAAALCKVIRETTASGDLVNVIGVDALEGWLLARAGDLEAGEQMVMRAVERAEHIDFYDQKALVFVMLAKTHEVAGRRGEAVAAAQVALAIFEAKGDKASTARLRELVSSLAG
jgi:class 3 adenylate cyclase/tetratricopeptide (TPR) repeat protein